MTQTGGRLPTANEQEAVEMPETHCAKCVLSDQSDYFLIGIDHRSDVVTRRNKQALTVTAVFGCSNGHPLHEWPVRLQHNRIVETAEGLDPIGTDGLPADIAPGLSQDLRDAAKCYHYGLNKAAVVIARRTLQLAFEDKIPGLDLAKRWTLGPLIKAARAIAPPMMTQAGFSHADIVLQFGNDGAHDAVDIDARDARTVVWAAVRVLTELAPLTRAQQADLRR